MENIAEINDKIDRLTEMFGRFITQEGVVKTTQNMVQLSTQNNEGGIQKRQIARDSMELKKEELEFMQTQKNVRKRKDGRYEWQKMIAGEWHREIDRDYKELKRKIAAHERELKKILKHTRFLSRLKRNVPKLFDLCVEYVEVNKRKCNEKIFKAQKRIVEMHLKALDKPIDEYTKNEIAVYLDNLKGCKKDCYQILKNVFADATEQGTIERNVIATLKKPKVAEVKGRWFTIAEQKLIQARKHESGMADEIDFYLMVGCRAAEAHNCVPDFDRCQVYVERSKIDGTSGTVKISKAYAEILRTKWDTMFKKSAANYSIIFSNFLTAIGIKTKETHLHSLRHTFCSNWYYLGAPSKLRQYSMGHKDSRMTQDRYTTYDPNITKQDIMEIYGDLYPKFDDANKNAMAS
jgi:integrase